MKLTVLGCFGPYPPAGGACSGYLLEHEGSYILIDCGNGVLSKLQYHINTDRLAAVFISHLHSDHVSDLFIMRYALQIDMAKGKRQTPLKIFTPAEPSEERERLPYKDLYAIETIDSDKTVSLGSLDFSFLKTLHSIESYALKVQEKGGKSFVFSGDTAYFSELIQFVKGTDLFLCEANYLQADLEQGAPSNHLSASQAGQIALKADVRNLLLTHLPPYRESRVYLAEARAFFPDASLAEEGKTYTLLKGRDSSE